MTWTAALIPLGGLLNRWRGGWNPLFRSPGIQVKRLVFAALTAAYAGLLFGWGLADWPFYLAITAAWWLGLVPGWGLWHDMGTVKGTMLGDFLGMVWRGYLWSVLVGLALFYPEPWAATIFAASGFGLGLAYLIAHLLPKGLSWRGTIAAEIMAGTWFWAALWAGSQFD